MKANPVTATASLRGKSQSTVDRHVAALLAMTGEMDRHVASLLAMTAAVKHRP